MIIYPYKPGSASSKALAEALGIKRISHKNSKFKGNPDKVVINWGASKVSEEVAKCTIINHPDAVAKAANKLSFFKAMDEEEHIIRNNGIFIVAPSYVKPEEVLNHIQLDCSHPFYWKEAKVGDRCLMDNNYYVVKVEHPRKPVCNVPQYTTEKDIVVDWLLDGSEVVARTVLNGNSGEGIVLLQPGDDIVDAPLYVKYIPKKQEYRVHVFKGECVDVQRKARRRDVEDDKINWKIRNHDNGFIFARGENLGDVPEDVIKQAVDCVNGCGLDFGAVDVIYNDKMQKAFVLEVNSAPGLTGATLDGYVERFKEMM